MDMDRTPPSIILPRQPFRLNLIIVFAFTMAALIILHLTDRRAGGE